MKTLANTLLILGLVIMALSLPYTGQIEATKGAGICLGALMACAGLFISNRAREGVSLFAITDKDRAEIKEEIKEVKRDFAPSKLLAKLLVSFGGLFVTAAIYSLFEHDSPRTKFSTIVFMILVGAMFIGAAVMLVKPQNPNRSPYWWPAVSGMTCAVCVLIFAVLAAYVMHMPKEKIPDWVAIAAVMSIFIGALAAITCIVTGIRAIKDQNQKQMRMLRTASSDTSPPSTP